MFIASPEGRVQDFAYAKYFVKRIPASSDAVRVCFRAHFERATGKKITRVFESEGKLEAEVDGKSIDTLDASDKLFVLYSVCMTYTRFAIARDGSIVLTGNYYTKADDKKRQVLVAGSLARRLYFEVLCVDLLKHIEAGGRIESDLLEEWQRALDASSKNLDDLLVKIERMVDDLERRADDALYDAGKRAEELLDAAGKRAAELGRKAREGLKQFFDRM